MHLQIVEGTSGGVGRSVVSGSGSEVAGPCAEWAEAERSGGVVPPDKELQARVWISSRLEASEGNLVWLKCREVLSEASSAAQEEASRYYRSWKSQEPISEIEGVSSRAAWMGLGLVVLDHAARGTINEQCEPLTESRCPMSLQRLSIGPPLRYHAPRAMDLSRAECTKASGAGLAIDQRQLGVPSTLADFPICTNRESPRSSSWP